MGEKKAKGQASKEAARERQLKKLLGQSEAQGQFADPAAMFQKLK